MPWKEACGFLSLGFTAFGGLCLWKGNEHFYSEIAMPLSHKILSAESAHNVSVWLAKHGFFRTGFSSLIVSSDEKSKLRRCVFGLEFDHPIGIAAGFDKQGDAVIGLLDSGFSFVEVGSVTPLPQPGNSQPRVFRLAADRAVINRYGFNSEGHHLVLEKLRAVRRQFAQEDAAKVKVGQSESENENKRENGSENESARSRIIGVNLGVNKDTQDRIADFCRGVQAFHEVADYLVINVSSPNTAGLRDMQEQRQLEATLERVLQTRDALSAKRRCPILLKISPDESSQSLDCIAQTLRDPRYRVDGLIISNTTLSRPAQLLESDAKLLQESGGLSGVPLKDISTRTIRTMHEKLPDLPIIGVGGVNSGQSALEKLQAGASLVQIYTSLVYEGPPVLTKIHRELQRSLSE